MWLEPVGQDLTGVNDRVTVYLGASASTYSGVKYNFLFFLDTEIQWYHSFFLFIDINT